LLDDIFATGKAPLPGVEPTSNDGKRARLKIKLFLLLGKLMGRSKTEKPSGRIANKGN
jgi:hypothetical protein